jgi:hypothetical protein
MICERCCKHEGSCFACPCADADETELSAVHVHTDRLWQVLCRVSTGDLDRWDNDCEL